MKPREKLRPYQCELVERIKATPAILLNVPMGLGKTATVLTAIADLHRENPDLKVLIVAPLRVARFVWPEEIRSWEHTAHLSHAVATGTPTQRRQAAGKRATVTIVNFESMRWFVEEFGALSFDVVVVDESSRLKSGKKTSKGKADDKKRPMSAFGAVASLCLRAQRRILLTGTMAPNGIRDLWGQIYCLDGGARLAPSRTRFERQWFDQGWNGWTLTPRPGAEEEILARVKDVVVSVEQAGRVDLPKVVSTFVEVALPPGCLLEYDELRKTMVSRRLELSAANKAVLAGKLLQLCNGQAYREDGSVVTIHEAKLDALDELLAEVGDEPLLVMVNFRHDIAAIRHRYGTRSHVLADGDHDVVKRWNDRRIPMLVAHPKSCAHGLNLQFGGRRTVWYGPTWDLELYQQANARLPRPGQESGVCFTHHLTTRGTVERVVFDRLNTKRVTQDRITETFFE